MDLNRISLMDSLVERAGNIVITAHVHPDGDAVGSTTALLSYLVETRGKNALVILPEEVPSTLSFAVNPLYSKLILDASNKPGEAEAEIGRADLVFCLDCSSFDRTGPLKDAFTLCKARKILIDHHLNPKTEAFDTFFSTPDISSASELLYWILLSMPDIGNDPLNLPVPCRESLLTGMTTDTNNFANSVFPSTLEMASGLLAAGTDRDAILSSLYDNYRENRFRLMGRLLSEGLVITPEGAAYMILTSDLAKEFDIRDYETEGFVNLPLGIDRVRLSVFLKENETGFRVSVRSKEGTSAQNLAASYFNGGGHERAAGGTLSVPEDLPSKDAAVPFLEKTLERFFR